MSGDSNLLLILSYLGWFLIGFTCAKWKMRTRARGQYSENEARKSFALIWVMTTMLHKHGVENGALSKDDAQEIENALNVLSNHFSLKVVSSDPEVSLMVKGK